MLYARGREEKTGRELKVAIRYATGWGISRLKKKRKKKKKEKKAGHNPIKANKMPKLAFIEILPRPFIF
jgi:hypothetical protein